MFRDDITFCGEECDNIGCFRHHSNIENPQYPHSMALFRNTDYCPLNDPLGGMELGNFFWGNSRGEYKVGRGKFEELFSDFLEKNGFDSYGYIEDNELEKKYCKIIESKYSNKDIYGEECDNEDIKNNLDYHPHIHCFDNGTFMVNPYYWGDANDLCDMPNFIYYPENIQIQWYKYPLRDSYSNKRITIEKLQEILEECEKSLSK